MINNLTKLKIRVAGERTKGSIFTTLIETDFLDESEEYQTQTALCATIL